MHQAARTLFSSAFPGALALLCIASSAPLLAQTSLAASSASLADKSCILAGRIGSDQRWAPPARGVTLLDAAGKRVSGSSKEALVTVKSVRLSEPTLLSQCNGSQALASGESAKGSKSPAPAVKPGPLALNVQAMYFPPLRVGGEWVELQLELPADRLIASAR